MQQQHVLHHAYTASPAEREMGDDEVLKHIINKYWGCGSHSVIST
jgi:hypothetical protein